ncbi:MAG: YqjK family protein [Nitrospirota bacterium]
MKMNARLTNIRQRRAALVQRAETQRRTLADLVQPLQAPFHLLDGAITIAREVRAHWVTLAAGTTLLTWMGRGTLGVWVGRIWVAWSLFHSLRNPGARDNP